VTGDPFLPQANGFEVGFSITHPYILVAFGHIDLG
jgi:hypothetical protein